MNDVSSAYEIARRYIRQKKKLMSQKTADNFIKSLYLVFIGVRDAYMFENFSCADSVAFELVDNMQRIFGISKKVIIIILETLDVVVMMEEKFLSKKECIEKNSHLPIIIGVTIAPDPIVYGKVESGIIWGRLLLLLHEAPTSKEASSTRCTLFYPATDASVGSVLFAGWCLGYPFLYHYIPGTSSGEVGCTVLAMQTLVKTSLQIDIKSISTIAYPFMEFTVPKDCLTACLHEFDIEYENIGALMRSQIMNIQISNSKSHSTDAPIAASSEVDPLIGEITYTVSEFQLPHIML